VQLGSVIRGRGARDTRNLSFLQEFIRPGGLAVPATPQFVAAVEALAAETAPAPDLRFPASSRAGGWAGLLAARTRSGVGQWLMMDPTDVGRAKSEQERAALKDNLVTTRESYRRAKADRLQQLAREKQRAQRSKGWARWRRGLSIRKQVARLKGSLKQMVSERPQ